MKGTLMVARSEVVLAFLITLSLFVCTPGWAQPTIEVWSGQLRGGLDKWLLEDLLPRFEQEYGLAVSWKQMDLQHPEQSLRENFGAGGGPDLLYGSPYWLHSLVGEGFLIPLDRLFSQWHDRSAIFSGLVQPELQSRQLFVIPHAIELSSTKVYNRTVFAEHGLDPDRPPGTWDDLYLTAEKLTSHGDGYPRKLGFYSGASSLLVFDHFFEEAGGRLWSDDFRDVILDDISGIRTAKFVKSLMGLMFPDNTAGIEEWPRPISEWGRLALGEITESERAQYIYPPWVRGVYDLASGRVGMYLPSYTTVSFINQLEDIKARWRSEMNDFDWGAEIRPFFSHPTGVDRPNVEVGYSGFALGRNADPGVAWQFVDWIMSRDVMARMPEATDYLPTRRDLSISSSLNPYIAVWYEALRFARYSPSPPRELIASQSPTEMETVFRKMFAGNIQIEHGLSEIARDMQTRTNRFWDEWERVSR